MYKELLANLDDAQLMDLFKIILQEGANRKLEKEFREIETDEREMAEITRAAYQTEYNRQIAIQKDLAIEEAKKRAAADAAAKFNTASPTPSPVNGTQVMWAKRKAIVAVLEEIGVNPNVYWELKIWDHRLNIWNRSDKRLYLNNINSKAIATYYHEGTNKNPPQSISFSESIKNLFPDKVITNKQKTQLKQIFTALCNNWNTLAFDNSSTNNFDGDPDPQTLAKYLKVIEIPTN